MRTKYNGQLGKSERAKSSTCYGTNQWSPINDTLRLAMHYDVDVEPDNDISNCGI